MAVIMLRQNKVHPGARQGRRGCSGVALLLTVCNSAAGSLLCQFQLHLECTASGDRSGCTLKLGYSRSAAFLQAHKVIGITLACTAGAQLLLALLRPKPDAEIRK